MPKPDRLQQLRDELKDYFIKGMGFETRRSPLGITEHIIPEGVLQDLAFSIVPRSSVAYSLPGYRGMAPINIYRKGGEDRPEIREHERIHAGQHMLRNRLSAEVAKRIFPQQTYGAEQKVPDYEIPAYELAYPEQDIVRDLLQKAEPGEANWKKWIIEATREKILKQQLGYNEWMDYINRVNPEDADIAEAPYPESLQRNRIMNWPNKLDSKYVPQLPRPRVIK